VLLAASVIQLAPAAPQLERMARMARDDDVRVRRDVRDGVRCPVPGVAEGDSARMMVLLGTVRLEHDVPADKSKGELSPTAMFRAGYGYFLQTARAIRRAQTHSRLVEPAMNARRW
jgi:hypothetical protein